MPASIDVRRDAFAAWVRRVTEHADDTRRLSIPRIAKRAGINDATIYRWRDGTMVGLPKPEQVVAFSDALDIPPSVPFAILWPGKDDEAPEPEPLPADPDVERQVRELMRRLADPDVDDGEKTSIRATIRHLTSAPARRRTAG